MSARANGAAFACHVGCTILLLGTAYSCQQASFDYKDAYRTNSRHYRAWLNESATTLIEYRKRHDVLHGAWHCLTAVVLTQIGLVALENMGGPLTLVGAGCENALTLAPERRTGPHAMEEATSMLTLVSIALVCLVLVSADVPSEAWLVAWLVMETLCWPMAFLLLRRVLHRHLGTGLGPDRRGERGIAWLRRALLLLPLIMCAACWLAGASPFRSVEHSSLLREAWARSPLVRAFDASSVRSASTNTSSTSVVVLPRNRTGNATSEYTLPNRAFRAHRRGGGRRRAVI
mmetsp:Transcript_84128/g.167896  ORF Transcript_84128/g.167896 Transcript_84128/m.167896 type:complete len:289 (-) Transcript_84128:32-898(-)